MKSSFAQRNISTRVLVGAGIVALLCFTILSSPASAQVGVYGSVVKPGDADWFPSGKKAAAAPQVLYYDPSGTGFANNLCVVLRSGAAPGAVGSLSPVTTKDIRLTPCDGYPAGSLVQAVDAKLVNYIYAGVATAGIGAFPSFQYYDMNNNAKFDNGDVMYLTTSASNGITGASTIGAGVQTFTVRLNPVPSMNLQPGNVLPSDLDFNQFGPAVRSSSDATFNLVEREGGWILLPVKDGVPGIDALVPANSIRLTLGQTNYQPGVVPVGITIGNADTFQAGQSVSIVVRVTNGGKGAGAGLIETKIAGRLVDARMTPILSPAEFANVVVTFLLPADLAGSQELAANDIFQVVTVKAAAGTTPVSHLSAATDLQATVDQLQARIASLEASRAAPASPVAAPMIAKAPAIEPAVVLVALGGMVALMRRKA